MISPETSLSPIFIVGVQRSGTTMLRLMLNMHPNIAIPFETGFIPIFFRRLGDYGDLAEKGNVSRLLDDISAYRKIREGDLIPSKDAILDYPIAEYRDLVSAIMSEFARRRNKPRWGDKTPFYVTELDVIWNLFPHCRIVHVIRDGRDVAVSQRSTGWASTNVARLAELWRWKTTLAHKIGAVLGTSYLEIRYEDLVSEPEATLRNICAFVDEPFCDDLLAYHEAAENEMPAHSMKWHAHSIKPPDRSKIGLWKTALSRADRIIFEQVAGETLEDFGYETERLSPTIESRIKNLYYCLVKRW